MDILDGTQIKQILYSVIEQIGKEKIQSDITADIKSSQKYIDIVMEKSITKINSERNDDCECIDEITTGTLCEALLHFMLTICTMPSERKIQLSRDVTLDVIIPNVQSLRTDFNKAIIVQIIKDKIIDIDKISHLHNFQRNYNNIWLISTNPLPITKYTTYSVFPNTRFRNYSRIIVDIYNFLKETDDKSFRFIH